MHTDELMEETAAKHEILRTKLTELTKKLDRYKDTLHQTLISHTGTENEINALLKDQQNRKTLISIDLKNEDLQQSNFTAADLNNNVRDMKALIVKLENDLKDVQEKEAKNADNFIKKSENEAQIRRIVEEYEKSISQFVADNEKLKKERDTAQMLLVNIEKAFSDVHQKYERCKEVVQKYKDNEKAFRKDISMNRETIAMQEQKYEALKAHATAQVKKFNEELLTLKKYQDTEISRLTVLLKSYQIQHVSLKESLVQKMVECENLSKVCDDYIGNLQESTACSEK